jgi:hypothetical protein
LVTVAVRAGAGRHAAVLSTPDLEKAIFFTTIGFIPGILSFTVPKFAVIILVTKLLNPYRWQKWIMWILAIINLSLILVTIAIVFAQCDPPRAMWTIGIDFKCWDPIVLVSATLCCGAFSALFDFYLALYPATVIWRLHMNLKKKLFVSIALGFGVCAGIVAIYKCTTIPGVGDRNDFTYSTENLIIWTSIEANCVIMAACLPLLMPLAELIFGKNFLSSGPKPIRTPHSCLKKVKAYTKLPRIEAVPRTTTSEGTASQRGVDNQESILSTV